MPVVVTLGGLPPIAALRRRAVDGRTDLRGHRFDWGVHAAGDAAR